MLIGDQEQKTKRINEFIKECTDKGMTRAEINKELKRKYHVHFKDNPTSKYERHAGAKEKAKNLKRLQNSRGGKA